MSEPTAWVCVNSLGHLLTSTIADKRGSSIKKMVGGEPGHLNRWRWWKRRHGVSCVRVFLIVDTPKAAGRE